MSITYPPEMLPKPDEGEVAEVIAEIAGLKTIIDLACGISITQVLPDGSVKRIDPRDFFASPHDTPSPASHQ